MVSKERKKEFEILSLILSKFGVNFEDFGLQEISLNPSQGKINLSYVDFNLKK